MSRKIKIGKVVLTNGGEWNATTGYAKLTYVLHSGDGWWSVKANVNSEPSATNVNWIQATDTQSLRTAMQALITSATALETALEAAESLRVSAETARATAEASRVSSENSRVQAENSRVSSENSRVDAESARVSSENLRVSQENARVQAERNRVSAETARETAATQAIANANAATNTANAAAATAQSASATATAASTLANKAVEDANEVIETMNAKIAVANTDHTRAEGDHSTATTDHSNAATDHTTAGTDHSIAASDHSTAASDHTAASTDHSNATADHTQAQSDHNTAASDHETAQSDHTLAVADHTNMGARVTSLEQTKADKNGHYEGMSVAMAENLIGKGNATEQTFAERVAGGGASIEDGVAEYRKIKGNSIAWRQMAGTTNIIDNNCTHTINDDGSIHVNSNGGEYSYVFIGGVFIGHKILTCSKINCEEPCDAFFSDGTKEKNYSLQSGWRDIVDIMTTSIDATRLCVAVKYKSYDVVMRFIDLTLTFGSAIADTITTADDVAKLLGYASWDAYAASEQFATDMQYSENGEIRNFTAKKVVTTGRNLCCPFEVSDIRLISVDYIEVQQNNTYYLGSEKLYQVRCYDANKNDIGEASYVYLANAFNVIPKDGTCFVKIILDSTSASTNISFNIYDEQYNGTYEPYETHELDVDPSTIKDSNGQQLFPYGLCKVGDVYDEITKDGAVKRVGCVKLKELSWAKYEECTFICNSPNDSFNNIHQAVTSNSFCNKYIVTSQILGLKEESNKIIFVNSGGISVNKKTVVKDSSYTDAASFTASLTDSDLLFYELATPISVTFADERQTDVEVFSGGTEKIVVAEGGKSTPIVADVNYGIDYVGTIDRLHDDVGKASDLTTTAKNTLVAAINELVARVAALETSTTNEGGAE